MITLSEAVNRDSINEWHWFIDPAYVNFTNFDSCIGIVAPVQVRGADQVIGIHLVQVTDSNEEISLEDMDSVVSLLKSKGYNVASNKAVIIGQIVSWRNSRGIQYQRLKQGLQIIGNGHQIDLPQGNYGGRFVATQQGTKFHLRMNRNEIDDDYDI